MAPARPLTKPFHEFLSCTISSGCLSFKHFFLLSCSQAYYPPLYSCASALLLKLHSFSYILFHQPVLFILLICQHHLKTFSLTTSLQPFLMMYKCHSLIFHFVTPSHSKHPSLKLFICTEFILDFLYSQ